MMEDKCTGKGKPEMQSLPIISDTNLDQWKHRSDNMRCKTCMWFVPKLTRIEIPHDGFTETKHRPGSFGRCRKHAPTLNGWPAVFSTDWCGDHKLDENKI